MQPITPFLMFEGNAEEAMNFYISLFKNAEITQMVRYSKDGPGKDGSVKLAHFSLDGQEFMCTDSPIHHGFTFTPAISFYLHCGSEEEIELLFAKLSNGGQVLMPLQKYPFSDKFGWCADKFGVSWQLTIRK